MNTEKPNQTIVITGASSGIGTALALEYAAAHVFLALFGRNIERLEAVAAQCQKKGASVSVFALDVTNAQAMETTLTALDAEHPIDLLIANAGISGGTFGGGESATQTRHIFAVNVDGVLNTILPIATRMTVRKSGQIALMASLAAFRGLPGAPAYSASKAAVKHYGEALRGDLGKFDVKLSVICPGYIQTPMTEKNHFPMPFLMSPKTAAKRIRKGLERNTARIAFPKRLYWPIWLISCLPPCITDPLFAHLPKKG